MPSSEPDSPLRPVSAQSQAKIDRETIKGCLSAILAMQTHIDELEAQLAAHRADWIDLADFMADYQSGRLV